MASTAFFTETSVVVILEDIRASTSIGATLVLSDVESELRLSGAHALYHWLYEFQW